MKCPNCGRECSDSDNFCTACGTKLEQPYMDSRAQAYIDANRLMLNRQLDIFKDSLHLVRDSENLETVSQRYDDLIKISHKILQMPDAVLAALGLDDFDDIVADVEASKTDIFNNAVERSFRHAAAEIDNLKTEKGKEERIARYYDLVINKVEIPDESRQYAHQLLCKEYPAVIDSVTPFNSSLPVPIASLASYAIPEEILELLWFADGPMKNYDLGKYDRVFQVGNLRYTSSGEEEPSLISLSFEIGIPEFPAPKLDYYPSYQRIDPVQRACYLTWLHDIDSEIDIGYVFLFYYGLERFLYLDKGKFEKAFLMILRLIKHHSNHSFRYYSSNALMGACIVHNRLDFMNIVFSEVDTDVSILPLACMAKLHLTLDVDHILEVASTVGFTNRRYIKSEPALFKQILLELLKERFMDSGYPLTDIHIEEGIQSPASTCANVSLPFREMQIVNIAAGKTFRAELFSLLSDTHETVKKILKEKRKIVRGVKMVRDMDLCRKILFEIENRYVDTALANLDIDGYSMAKVAYHCKLLNKAGMIDYYEPHYADDSLNYFFVGSLTWDGHDFLDKIREEGFWNKIKNDIKEQGLPLTLAVIQMAVTAAVDYAAKKAFGR